MVFLVQRGVDIIFTLRLLGQINQSEIYAK